MHNDVKLENLLVGHTDTDRLYLIDFGLASHYLDEETGEHIEKKNLRKFSGNFMFASLNALRGNNKSRRDDFESAIYVLIYLINRSRLPWSDFCTKFQDKNYNFTDLIKERLRQKYSIQLIKQVPSDLHAIVKKTLCLGFKDDPPYDELLNCLQVCF